MAQLLGKLKNLVIVARTAHSWSLSSARFCFSNSSTAAYSSFRKMHMDHNMPEPPERQHKPKRPPNAFALFASQSGKSHKECGALWRNMSAAEQQPFIDLFEEKDAQYRRELAAWKQQIVADDRRSFEDEPDKGRTARISFRKLCKNAGIPEPPKRPPNGFQKFRSEQLAKGAVLDKISDQWRGLPDSHRQKYAENWTEQMTLYKMQNSQHKCQLTSSQMAAIVAEEINIIDDQRQRLAKQEHRAECQQTNKPKRPLNAFLLFKDASGKTFEECSTLWRNMNAADKQTYFEGYQEKTEQYQRELAEWEQQMLANGRRYLVRKQTLAEERRKRERALSENATKVLS